MADAPSSSPARACPECGAVAGGDYCARCGHPIVVQRLTIRSIIATCVEHFLSLDFPMMRTVVDQMRWPGWVPSEYVAGRRRTYANPLRFSLITGAILVAVVHFAIETEAQQAQPLAALGDSPPEELAKEGVALALKWHNDYLAIVYLLGLPILALFMRLMFWRSGRNVLEHYAMCLFGDHVLATPFQVITGLAPYVYFPWAAVVFTRARGRLALVWAVIRSLIAFFIFSIVIFVILTAAAAGFLLIKNPIAASP